jgi:hypothetical protein
MLTHSLTASSDPGAIYDFSSRLWTSRGLQERFYPDLQIQHRLQEGGSCVSTGLSLLTNEEPELIRTNINTQDPTSWSYYLLQHGMKLAYCNTDFRRLKHYQEELLALDDLFAVSTYSPGNPFDIGEEPDENGWICSSHFFIVYGSMVYDTTYVSPVELTRYLDKGRYVKRLFRVVPEWHERGV